ncbi:hypothetical protein BXZ70DRAFT_1079866 [Cristinia sonorae]|uniref:Uncharacterized protein n=1 Tax=Cristinia sonorae TaxID=1940300 RepID=A0A8K0XLI4_9AGAR|nr:hypothetical protein BXZ70DRAFT_1079866 [Cristinia sonorae]
MAVGAGVGVMAGWRGEAGRRCGDGACEGGNKVTHRLASWPSDSPPPSLSCGPSSHGILVHSGDPCLLVAVLALSVKRYHAPSWTDGLHDMAALQQLLYWGHVDIIDVFPLKTMDVERDTDVGPPPALRSAVHPLGENHWLWVILMCAQALSFALSPTTPENTGGMLKRSVIWGQKRLWGMLWGRVRVLAVGDDDDGRARGKEAGKMSRGGREEGSHLHTSDYPY